MQANPTGKDLFENCNGEDADRPLCRGYVVGIADALHRFAARGARLAVPSVHGHVLAKRRDVLGEPVRRFGTETVDPVRIEQAVRTVFDLRPAAIIRDLDLRRPIYRRTAAYGHFGRPEKEFTWEHTTRLDAFKQELGL